MTDRPILFSGPMVRAILDGRKSQTRRVLSMAHIGYAPGDRLWVKETWRASYGLDYYRDDLGRCPRPSDMDPATTAIEYLADGERELGGRDHPSIHMPRWASRLTLTVTNVRVERLKDISEADAIREGVTLIQGSLEDPVGAFRSIWSSINTATGKRWEDNPWVCAITFDTRRGNIDGGEA